MFIHLYMHVYILTYKYTYIYIYMPMYIVIFPLLCLSQRACVQTVSRIWVIPLHSDAQAMGLAPEFPHLLCEASRVFRFCHGVCRVGRAGIRPQGQPIFLHLLQYPDISDLKVTDFA